MKRIYNSNKAIPTMAEITIRCKRTVVSTKAVKPGKFHSLSVLDRMMEPYNLRIVYYYQMPSDCSADGSMTKKLRETLAEALSSYPITTGRLVRTEEGQWMIKCNDAGMRMIEARARGSIHEWLRTATREQELKLVYWEDMFHKPYFWSTFYVQVTEFEGGGVAIGLSCTHLLADAACATMLIKSWADTTIKGKILSPPSFQPLPPRKLGYDRTNYKPNINLINHYKSATSKTKHKENMNQENFATVIFSFTEGMVKQCMAKVQTSTPFEALAALFWVTVSKVKGRKEGLSNMSICLEMRNVLELDKGFFGNAMVFNRVNGDGLQEGGLVRAASALSDLMGDMVNDGVMDLIEWLESDKDSSEMPSQCHTLLSDTELLCANWESLLPYDAMFEVGDEPIHVSYYLEHACREGQILILPSPPGQGSLSRVAMVTLPKDQVAKLCEEDTILDFSPTILMGVKKTQV